MKRIASVIALGAAGALLAAAPASADPSVCIDYDININGQGQAGSQCLPQ